MYMQKWVYTAGLRLLYVKMLACKASPWLVLGAWIWRGSSWLSGKKAHYTSTIWSIPNRCSSFRSLEFWYMPGSSWLLMKTLNHDVQDELPRGHSLHVVAEGIKGVLTTPAGKDSWKLAPGCLWTSSYVPCLYCWSSFLEADLDSYPFTVINHGQKHNYLLNAVNSLANHQTWGCA